MRACVVAHHGSSSWRTADRAILRRSLRRSRQRRRDGRGAAVPPRTGLQNPAAPRLRRRAAAGRPHRARYRSLRRPHLREHRRGPGASRSLDSTAIIKRRCACRRVPPQARSTPGAPSMIGSPRRPPSTRGASALFYYYRVPRIDLEARLAGEGLPVRISTGMDTQALSTSTRQPGHQASCTHDQEGWSSCPPRQQPSCWQSSLPPLQHGSNHRVTQHHHLSSLALHG